MTVLVALMALCGANLALVWQVLKLTDKVYDMQEYMHVTAGRLMRELDSAHGSKEYRLRVYGMQKDGGDDGED